MGRYLVHKREQLDNVNYIKAFVLREQCYAMPYLTDTERYAELVYEVTSTLPFIYDRSQLC